MFNIFKRHLGRDSHTSNSMLCPACFANKAKFIEDAGPYMNRWRCGACGQTWKYVKNTAPPLSPEDVKKNPSLLVGNAIKQTRIPIVGRENRRLVRKIASGQSR